MATSGLTVAKEGNVSARVDAEQLIVITPHGIPYESMVPGFNVVNAVKRARTPITIMANAVNEPLVNPRTVNSGTRLVELSVIELVKV
jgi:hypothetical protein